MSMHGRHKCYEPECKDCVERYAIQSRRSTFVILLQLELKAMLAMHGVTVSHQEIRERLQWLKDNAQPDKDDSWTYAYRIKSGEIPSSLQPVKPTYTPKVIPAGKRVPMGISTIVTREKGEE